MDVRIQAAADKGRIVAIRVADLTLRCMENWRRLAGGYDEAMILVAVVAITAPRLPNQKIPEEYESLEQVLPERAIGPCNVSSIASAVGLNRETTRRKVEQLIKQRFLEKDGQGKVRLRRGLTQEEKTQALINSQLEAIRRLTENFVRDGVFLIASR